MSDDTDSGDRPASVEFEIEITPEMIEAGVKAYHDVDGWHCSTPAATAIAIFTAMAEVSESLCNLLLHLEAGIVETHQKSMMREAYCVVPGVSICCVRP